MPRPSDFDEYYRRTAGNIFEFAKEIRFPPTPQQHELMLALQRGYKRIVAKSGQGVGKSAVAAVAGMWRSYRRYKGQTYVTAPSMHQCRDVLLTECRRRLDFAVPRMQRIFNVTRSRVEIFGDPDWGVKLVTAARPENMQGRHNDGLTFILDEMSGIERPFIEQIEGTLSNPDSMMLGLGNPNTQDCAMYDCFNRFKKRWHRLTFNSEESPLVSRENIEYLAEKYGRDSDVYRVRVLGEFPLEDPQSAIPRSALEACTKTDLLTLARSSRPGMSFLGPARQIAIDLARFGADESVVYRRVGQSIVEEAVFAHRDPNDVVDAAFEMQRNAAWKNNDCWYVVDAGGMGQGVLRRFYSARKQVMPFYNQGAATSASYENKITEAWFLLGNAVKAHTVFLPDDEELLTQLAARRYKLTTKHNKFVLEKKEEYKKRMGHSPDRGETAAMAFYDRMLAPGRVADLKATHPIGRVVRR